MKKSLRLLAPALALTLMITAAGPSEAEAQGAPTAANQTTLAADEARHMFGDWSLTLMTPDGELPLSFTIGERDGRVALFFGGPEGQPITNISKAENGFLVRSQTEYQGMNLPMVITVTPDGENLKTDWDFGDGAYVVTATAVKAR